MADPIRRIIPLSIDVEDNSSRIIYEGGGDAAAWFFRGNSITFAVTLLKGGVALDLEDVTKLRLVVKPLDRDRAPHPDWDALMLKEVDGPFEGNDVDVDFEPAESAIVAGARWLVINLYDADGNILTTAAGRINVRENGTNDHEAPENIVEARDEAIQAAIDAKLYRDEGEGFRDESEGFRNETEAFRDQSEGFKNTTETAAGNASASAEQAQEFRNQSQGFRNESEGFKNATETAAGNAATSESNAEASAETATDEADRAESEADRATTQANRSEAQANRSQNIADNLQALAASLSYRGEWNGTVAPSGAQRGWFWVVSASNTWGGITWALGDAALYNGSAWQRVALDWLLAQANANIAALRLEVNLRKQPQGGMYFTQTGGAVLRSLSINDLAQGGTQSFALAARVKIITLSGGSLSSVFGSTRGYFGRNTGSAGIQVRANGLVIAGAEVSQTVAVNVDANINILNRDSHVGISYNAATKIVSIYVDGVLAATGDWSTAPLNATQPLRLMLATTGTNVSDDSAGCVGYTYSAQAFIGDLTAGDFAELAATGGKIVPVALRASCVLNLQCDDGAGYQLHDHSGNGQHALITATGGTHLLTGDGAPLSAEGVNAASATYLLRSDTILPANAVVVGAIVDGEYLPAEGAQNLTHYRIRLNPSSGSLQVQRSNGSTHQTLATFTPASLASVSVTILYRLIK